MALEILLKCMHQIKHNLQYTLLIYQIFNNTPADIHRSISTKKSVTKEINTPSFLKGSVASAAGFLSAAVAVADAPSLRSEFSPHDRTPRTFARHCLSVCIHHVLS